MPVDMPIEELARLGDAAYQRVVNPVVRPEDYGKFAVIDVLSDDFELDTDDYAASQRLRARRPDGDFWLSRVGYATAGRIRDYGPLR